MMPRRVGIASDHAGFGLKQVLVEHLTKRGLTVIDFGPVEPERCDYSDFAHALCHSMQQNEIAEGVLVCGTGIGMSMTANKHIGIRAAVVSDVFSAKATKQHNNANVLCMGERVVGAGLAQEIVDTWLDSTFEGGRHQNRIDKMMSWEQNR